MNKNLILQDEKKIETDSSNFNFDLKSNKDSNLNSFQPINSDIDKNTIKTNKNINKYKYVFNFISIILIIISNIFLFKSYQSYEEQENYPIKNFFKKIGKNLILAGLSFSFIPVFIIEELIHKIFIIILSFYYGIVFCFNNGNTYKNHGFYNNIGFFFVVCYFSIIHLFLIWILKKISHKLLKILFCLFSIFFIFLMLIILIHTYYNNFIFDIEPDIIVIKNNDENQKEIKDPHEECLKWGYGLGGVRLENKEESKINNNSCYMKYPNKCYRFIYDNVFDFSKNENMNCSNLNKNSRNRLIKYLKKYNKNNFSSTYNFAYPLTNSITSDSERITPNFGKIVLKKIYDLDKAEKDKIPPEITISFDKEGKGKVNINIQRNNELINQKSKKFEKIKNNVRYENIYIIYIDSLGREQFYKKLPKTRKILENYYWNNNKKLNSATSFQFLKYQNFAGWTDINVFPMFYGKKFMEKGNNIVYYYNERGYITAQAGGDCNRHVFGVFNWNVQYLKGLYFDHELISLFCDPHFIDMEDLYSNKNKKLGPESSYRNCLYGKDACEYSFEYGLKFIETYKDQPKFLRLWFEDAHEDTQEKVKYMDDSISNFIQNVIDNYFTKKDLIIFVTDHGRSIHNFGQKFTADDGEIERTIGMLFLIYNDNETYYNKSALIINEQKFITPYDVFMTMLLNFNDIDEKVKNKKGQELDVEINGMKRNCYAYDDYNVKGEKTETFCKCINF